MSFLDRLRVCQVFDRSRYLPFRVDDADVGLIRPELARLLAEFPEVFVVGGDCVRLAPERTGERVRTQAVDEVLRQLAGRGILRGWRDEPYPVRAGSAGPTLFTIERAAVPLFGIGAFGVHVNGFVRTADGLFMWIGRRSPHRPVAPGKLDQLVAGGQPANLGIRENLLKEADEEASIPPRLAATAVSVGAIAYRTERPEGLRNDVLYVFDLELPADFVPRNKDGEISEFFLWPIETVMRRVRDTEDFKFNCSLVVIDFLIRHGFLGPEDPDYLDLLAGLHCAEGPRSRATKS